MAGRSATRITLTRARFFADQAGLSSSAEREVFETFLESAIVWGRSVTLHIKKQYRHRPGFDSWYSTHETRMREDPVFGFFLNTRNFILKEGPVAVHKNVTLSIQNSTIVVSDFADVRLKRGEAWHQRSIKTLWEDLRTLLSRFIRKWCHRRKSGLRHAITRENSIAQGSENFYFDDQRFRDRPRLCHNQVHNGNLDQTHSPTAGLRSYQIHEAVGKGTTRQLGEYFSEAR